MSLASKHCAPEYGKQALTGAEAKRYLAQLPDWELASDAKSVNIYVEFKNFAAALDFTNKIGVIAEAEGHHPDIGLGWGYVDVTLMTHDIDGLTENDFIVAAKISAILPQ